MTVPGRIEAALRVYPNKGTLSDIHSGLISDAHDGLSAGVELSCDGGDRYAVLQQIFHLGLLIGSYRRWSPKRLTDEKLRDAIGIFPPKSAA